MSAFNISGLYTIHGEASNEFMVKYHTYTDWKVYIDNIQVDESLNDNINLTRWDKAIMGNNGKPYDGTNGILTCKVRIKVAKEWSNWKWLICVTDMEVHHDLLDNGMLVDIYPREVRFKEDKIDIEIVDPDTEVRLNSTETVYPYPPYDGDSSMYYDTIRYTGIVNINPTELKFTKNRPVIGIVNGTSITVYDEI